MTAIDGAAVVGCFFDAAARMDTGALLALLHPLAVSHDPVGSEPITTVEAHRTLFDSTSGYFASIGFDVDIRHRGDALVAARWSADAILVDGRASAFGGFDVFTLAASPAIAGRPLITGHWGFWDPADIERHAMPAR